MKQSTQMENRNDTNVNFGMYEADRVAKAKAQPQLPSVTDSGKGEGNAPSFEAHECNAITDRIQNQFAPFDEKSEHENDLEWESRQDFATWERDGDTREMEDATE